MLFWIYIAIVLVCAVLIIIELFDEKEIKNQFALALILIPLLLRVFLIK
jgi:membrane protein YdbS with pleckstrin-like domain